MCMRTEIHSLERDILVKVPTCPFISLSPSQGAAAQRVSAAVSLAQDPTGPGLRGLSVLAATCYLTVPALTHKRDTRRNYAHNHRFN